MTQPSSVKSFDLYIGTLVAVRNYRHQNGTASVVWLAGIVTYVDLTGFEVRVGTRPEIIRLARWGEGDTWRRVGEVFT